MTDEELAEFLSYCVLHIHSGHETLKAGQMKGDQIRSMTNEKLVKFLSLNVDLACWLCPPAISCDYPDCKDKFRRLIIRDWLRADFTGEWKCGDWLPFN